MYRFQGFCTGSFQIMHLGDEFKVVIGHQNPGWSVSGQYMLGYSYFKEELDPKGQDLRGKH